MITKFSHSTLYVSNQDKALDFYVNKLGFQKRMDYTNENGFRWLTVGSKDQPDIDIVLMPVMSGPGMRFSKEEAAQMQVLLEKGLLSGGVFETSNCRAMFEELKAKGVRFEGEPTDAPWGVQCTLTDGVGNWYSVLEPKAQTWNK